MKKEKVNKQTNNQSKTEWFVLRPTKMSMIYLSQEHSNPQNQFQFWYSVLFITTCSGISRIGTLNTGALMIHLFLISLGQGI